MKHNILQRKRFFRLLFSLICLFIGINGFSQNGTISGVVSNEAGALEFTTISLSNINEAATTNLKGYYKINNIPYGSYDVSASYLGYIEVTQTVTIDENNSDLTLDFFLTEKSMTLETIVVSGTKTFKRQTNSPVIVNVINSKSLDNVQACNLSEGLKFQPGLRVETDCQTCNYTQLRMNGLAGGYSQILINGRPIFSPLTGLYGMEQLPVNMIDRIEVIRGGGSSLYGSSAIGGTVNVITKIPKKNSYEINYNYQNINNQTSDHQVMGNSTIVSDNKNAGISIFFNKRERGLYDHNDDNFSEIPLIENTSFGINTFFLPTDNQKLELSISQLNEFRYGGEMVDKPVYLTQQSEERTHNVWMGSLDYQVNFNNNKTSFISYAAWQNTARKHYTGILPDDEEEFQHHLENAPYGLSDVSTFNVGVQVNHQLDHFLNGKNILTFGSEYVYDDVYDEIVAYNYLIDQTTKDFGLFLQSDWEILPSLTLLTGVRMDKHNLVETPIFSPRASLLYKYKDFTQFRLSYGAGFRAPQSFDTDLHIAFAGGGISRVILSPDLNSEKSKSYSASINFDKPTDHFIAGFTLEGFYTRLNNAFYLEPIGADDFGELFEKRNGQGATVQGATVELRANYDRKVQVEAGFTLQRSQFDNAVKYIDELPAIREFTRTPNEYGFAMLSFTPNKKFNANINYVYTGTMKVPHFGGAPNQTKDEIITSKSFSELSAKMGYTVDMKRMKSKIEFYLGMKNITNAYQSSFDIGKNRDSNFVYGPAQPRTFFVGLKIRN